MGKRGKSKKLEISDDEEIIFINGNKKSRNNSSFVFIESDDDEANEDLSLKIIEKAMSRASNAAADSKLTDDGDDIVTTEFVASEIVKKKSKKEKKSKKKKVSKAESEPNLATLANEEDKGNTAKDAEMIVLSDSDGADNSNANNDVLRKLLRGPRYFDPPDKSWGACFNCGEEGHTTVNCTSAKRKKPCFICGSLEHEVKQCPKGKDCYICKGGGHRAKDCPKKHKCFSQASELCLKCGALAHAMSSCRSDYAHDDLKEIQCYVCKRFGHLCCVDYLDALSSEASCYKCGQSGHNGQECRGSHGETSAANTPTLCFRCGEEGHFARECTNSTKDFRGSHGETSAAGTTTSCFRCGEEGHFARECTNSISAKAKKRTHDFSTPTRKYSRDKTHKKRLQFDSGSPNWSGKSRRRGGWIPDDPSDLPPMNNGWRSPSTPNKKHKIYGLTSGGQGSSSHSSRRRGKYGSGAPSSQGHANGYHHRFSASRFGNSSNDGMRRDYDWW